MKFLLLSLLAAAVLFATTASAQTSDIPPPHVLFTPQSYHVATNESFSLTSYSYVYSDVVATVSYEECTCRNGRRTCDKKRDGVFSQSRGKTRRGRPVMLSVQMPTIRDLVGRNYFVNMTSPDGAVAYMGRRQLYFSGNDFGFLFVKTDKPIYKPEQEVNFCLAFLDKTLKPHKDNNEAEVIVYDSKSKQIMKWSSVRIPVADMTCLSLPLSEEPNFGTWRINANIKLPSEPGTGDCRVPHNPPRASCTFKVDEFVLPKFEVTLTGPKQLERDDDFIEAVVDAKYTFGENVDGRVKINATLMSNLRGESLVFFDTTATLVNGRYTVRIPSNSYRNAVRYRYDPFCVRSSIKLVAEVEESGRGTKIADSHTFQLVYSSVDVKFADDNPRVFRPGMTYTMKALAQLADGSVASGVGVRVKVTINNDVTTLFEDELLSGAENGAISMDISVPTHAECMKISLRPSSSMTSCQEEFECFSPSPLYSPTNSYLKLTDVSRRTPQPFSRVDISAESTVPFQILHLLVISQGSVQHHAFEFERNSTTSAVVSFRITYQMLPRVKVLGVFAREDGELVADLIELDVKCSLRHRVTTHFNQSHAEPGKPISLTATATPGSIVLLSVYDKSLSLLAEACKSLEKDNVCSLLRQLTGGSSFGGQSCNSDGQVSCCPLQCSEPTSYGVSNFFSAAGVSLSSNMFQPRPPVKVTPPPVLPLVPDDRFDLLRPEGPGGLPIVVPTEQPSTEEPVAAEDVRTFFPESWIFKLMRADRSGFVNMQTEVPDTLTTWYSEAYGLHSTTGLGVALQSQLTVIKPFFVSLELPFSVNFGEAVTITPLVFNLNRRTPSVTAKVTIAVHDDLDLVESTLPDNSQLVIEASGSKAFSMKLRPRAIGRLDITISATNDEGQSDAVRKALFVKPGCEKFEITQNIFAEGTGSHCFNYSLPSCVIPGSGSAVISATGDIMSPPNLDRLLVLPSGCGEQNLVKMATNWVVADYLVVTEQLSDFIAVKIKNNIQIGYQRELNYLQGSGCFSIWPRAKCSSWLTAAVVNVFSGIVNFYDEQEPGTEFIDMSVIDGGLNYIYGKQSKTGEFPVTGPVHNYELLRERTNIAHTAFTVVALKEYVDTFSGGESDTPNVRNARGAIRQASDYMTSLYDESEEFCNYALALSTFSMLRKPSAPSSPTITQMVTELKTRIVNSRDYPGACFVCNTCPSDRPSSSGSREGVGECAGGPSGGEGSAACVETTAYALLALLEAEDTTSTVCLAQWLVRIRSGSGGFYSSQDTVIAMQALARFSEVTYTSQLNKSIIFDIQGLSADPLTITEEGRFERKEYEVPSIPSNLNCVNWSGQGTAILQSTLTYYGCNCCNDTRAFSLELATAKTDSPIGDQLDLSMRLRYLVGRSSNMAIIDVEIPSGYIYTGWKYANDFAANAEVERVERRGANVIFYFQSVPDSHTTIVVEFLSRFTVEDPQQSPVTLYDYYDPGQTITKFYLPVTSDPLPPGSPLILVTSPESIPLPP